jgi:predicted transposase YbfD/YdcC
LIPQHGGFRDLKSFQIARLIYDITLRFCNRFVPFRSRTHDQMVHAARSGVQNIAEGSQASGTSKLDWLPQKEEWVDLNSLVCLRSTKTIKDKVSIEMRYYIGSEKNEAKEYGQKIRSHWGIENKVHWQLDVSYGEDKSKVRKDNCPENQSALKRCTMNLLKADTKTKAGIKNKRAKAGWDKEYMKDLLNGK